MYLRRSKAVAFEYWLWHKFYLEIAMGVQGLAPSCTTVSTMNPMFKKVTCEHLTSTIEFQFRAAPEVGDGNVEQQVPAQRPVRFNECSWQDRVEPSVCVGASICLHRFLGD